MTGHNRLMLAVALALLASSTQAATVTVDSNDDSAASTACNLRNALKSINGVAATVTCASAVTGAFGSNDTIVFAGSLANATITLTQGQLPLASASANIIGSGQTITAAGASRVFYVNGPHTLAVSGVTISAGHSATTGGAIFAGGGATLTLTNTTIAGSSAGTNGGGLFANGGTVTLNDATITNNTTPTTGGGGAIAVYQATLTINHSTISDNSGTKSGGIYLAGQSTGKISDSTISGNTATCGGSVCGAGIYIYTSTVDIIDSTISGNYAKNGIGMGGGIYASGSATTLVNTTITGNTTKGAQDMGAGIWENHFPVNPLGSLSLINCTVAQNTATGTGSNVAGGIASGLVNSQSQTKLTLTNTIVSSNSPAGSDVLFDATNAIVNTANNLLGAAQNVSAFNNPSNNNIFSDAPGLGPLHSNGGATQTMALMTGSLALAVGSVALALYSGQPLNYDQRGTGFVRTFSGTIDIGAFEAQRERIFADGFESEP